MKKLTLNLDELAVETFAPTDLGESDPTKTLLDLCTKMTGLCPCTPRADQF